MNSERHLRNAKGQHLRNKEPMGACTVRGRESERRCTATSKMADISSEEMAVCSACKQTMMKAKTT
eukprot:6207073-Pleurochrysis_carterae.AAC.1